MAVQWAGVTAAYVKYQMCYSIKLAKLKQDSLNILNVLHNGIILDLCNLCS